MDTEKIELPINLQKDCATALQTALPLCVLLSDDTEKGWYYENYIKIYTHFEYGNAFYCDYIDALNYSIDGFWDNRILRYTYTRKIILEQVKDISSVIKEAIFNEIYCVLFVDEYYIEELKNSQHFAHEILIYGYDDCEKNYLGIAFKLGKFSKILIPYEQMEEGYKNAFRYIGERGGWEGRMLIQFRKVWHISEYEFSNDIFLDNLRQYINSKYLKKDTYLAFFNELGGRIKSSPMREGISVKYDFIAYLIKLKEVLINNEENIQIVYIAFHTLRDHKRLLYDRIKYYIEKNKLKHLNGEILELKTIVEETERMRLLYMKLELLVKRKKYEKCLCIVDDILKIVESVFKIEEKIIKNILLDNEIKK